MDMETIEIRFKAKEMLDNMEMQDRWWEWEIDKEIIDKISRPIEMILVLLTVYSLLSTALRICITATIEMDTIR